MSIYTLIYIVMKEYQCTNMFGMNYREVYIDVLLKVKVRYVLKVKLVRLNGKTC